MAEERCPVCDRPRAPDVTPWGDKSLCYVWITCGARYSPKGTPLFESPKDDCEQHRVNWRDRCLKAREVLEQWLFVVPNPVQEAYRAMKILQGDRA